MTLAPAGPALATTRDALHRVAEDVLSALRVQETGGEIALTVRSGAVATPDLPRGGWVGVEDGVLVVVAADGSAQRHPLTTLRAAARAVGLRSADALPDEPLPVDLADAALLGGGYRLADAALRALRDEAADGDDPSAIRLWPEHFDIAFDQGSEADGRRAGYGFSPGDEQHPAPYAYVGPWGPPPGPADLWRATGFTGAELGWAELVAAADPQAALLAFWRTRRDALRG
jgi:hypothetical protein